MKGMLEHNGDEGNVLMWGRGRERNNITNFKEDGKAIQENRGKEIRHRKDKWKWKKGRFSLLSLVVYALVAI
jgi:hypothetical protein